MKMSKVEKGVTADLRRWGRAATSRVLSRIQEYGVIFDSYIGDEAG